MSQLVTEAHVNQYRANVYQAYQQQGSVLRGTVAERSVVGTADFWDEVGAVAATKLAVRHGPTPQADTPHSRRMVTLVDYATSDLVDKQDVIRILQDPKSEYASGQAKALGRAYDDEVIAAFYGDAKTGVAGATTLTFANDWSTTRSNTEGDRDSSAAALTIAELMVVKTMLDRQEVPSSGRHIVLTAAGINQLLATTQVSSSDYNTVKALAQGDLNTFAGFMFHRCERLPLAASTDYYGFAYHESSMAVSVGMDLLTRVTEESTLNYSWRVYAAMSFGATRRNGRGVVRWRFDNAL